MQVEFDRHSVWVDGERRLIRSGSLHYFRLPSPSLWRDRLEKMRDAGLNTVDLYYPWNYHSAARSEYDFAGFRDVDRLHDLIEQAGLWLIARPGPYVCAEIDGGGLPGWLRNLPGVIPRCRERTGFNYSRDFMEAVGEWFDQIVPRFAARTNLLAVQIENEYTIPQPLTWLNGDLADLLIRRFGSRGAYRWLGASRALRRLLRGRERPEVRESRMRGQRNPYMQELYQAVRDHGVSVPIFHNDVRATVGRQLDVDMIALDRYPTTDFERDWRDDADAFAAFDGDERAHDAHRTNSPVFYPELQGGWYDAWGGTGYARVRSLLGPDGIDGVTKAALAERATLWNYYMFCGGTTWGYMGSPDVYTSYDYGAPIAESGRTGPRYEAVRRLNDFLERFESDLAETDRVDEAAWSAEHLLTRQGRKNRYVFLRNPSRRPASSPTRESERSALEPWESQIRVYDDAGHLQAVSPEPVSWVAPASPPPPALPRLERWQFSDASPQLDVAYDDESWSAIDAAEVELDRIDIDSLGVHYGFIWYRGTFRGALDRLFLDARHCWAVWINRELVAAGDQFQNPLGVGPDGARTVRVPLRDVAWNEGRNVIVVLVESLGHNKGFADDFELPRGIVRIDTGHTPIAWRYRGGLVRGERGMNPLVAFEGVERFQGSEPVVLPHGWVEEPHGIGLYETTFHLEGIDPKDSALGLSFDPGLGKTNLYLNGYLVGRFWPEMGPQRQFLLPWGLLHPDEANHLAITVWKRQPRAALGKVRLQVL